MRDSFLRFYGIVILTAYRKTIYFIYHARLSDIFDALIKKEAKDMAIKIKYGFTCTLCLFLLLTGVFMGVVAAQGEAAEAGGITDSSWIAIASGIAMGASALGAGHAVAATGVAAAGTTAEKPELMGRVLIFVALGEAIAIYGLLIAFMLWTKI
jgi:V/A-type H+-transporting ATPase subunit K